MPFVNLKVTREAITPAQKAQIFAEFTDTLVRVLGKRPEHTHIVLDQVDADDWGFAGLTTTEFRARQKAAGGAGATAPASVRVMPAEPGRPHAAVAATTATGVVDAQLRAYNARDIDAFMATFAAECVVFDLDTNSERHRGIEAVRARYAEQFRTSPDQKSLVVSRTVVGEYVSDLELITGTRGPDGTPLAPYTLLAVYRVRAGEGEQGGGGVGAARIDRVWFSPRAAMV
jgi:4-oxalocrotonate tautomerase